MSSPEPAAANGRASARRELVEAQIYEQATRLFAERGFAGTSLQDVADAMGMTRSALYYYVRNKDQLLAQLVTEITSGPADAAEEIAGRDLDALGTHIVRAERTIKTEPELQRLIEPDANRPKIED